MRKRFNVTGLCVPEKHYMVDLTERIRQIKEMIDLGAYFTINRARQYGKTTTLTALAKTLQEEYLVLSLDFQMLGNASFQNENIFSLAFLQIFLKELERQKVSEISGMDELMRKMKGSLTEKDSHFSLLSLFEYLLSVCRCADKPIVLLIDEVDSATNNQVFLDFLSQLRGCYIERDSKGTVTFQSVILAGVYDVKNLKRKLRPDEEHKVNSPWNIAADFDVDMSLTKDGIMGMLKEYEADHQSGMDITEIAELLYEYTSGYPYLVSRLCKLLDEKVKLKDETENGESVWTKKGFLEAVRMLLAEQNTLFESLIAKLSDYPELNRMLMELLFFGKDISYNPTSPAIQLGFMFGFIKKEGGKVIPANRIFDTLLYNHFLSADELRDMDIYKASLEDYHLSVGYMISFNFNKNKQIGVHEISIGTKTLIEAVV